MFTFIYFLTSFLNCYSKRMEKYSGKHIHENSTHLNQRKFASKLFDLNQRFHKNHLFNAKLNI